ncbi:hypothetical protein N7488_008446 [Penicillium malachiteum]|nr:hypothetical protein N7488_008446 [Penicillium malachiteum]
MTQSHVDDVKGGQQEEEDLYLDVLPEEQIDLVAEERTDLEGIDLKNYQGVIDLNYYPEGDLAELLGQILIDDEDNAPLSDFNASQYPDNLALGYEKATHCLPRGYEAPNTVSSDLFALGSTLYEPVTGHVPYEELYANVREGPTADDDELRAQVQMRDIADYRVEQQYKQGIFPDVSQLFCGNIILGCWNGTIISANDALALYADLSQPVPVVIS